jgi:hypothetical protein
MLSLVPQSRPEYGMEIFHQLATSAAARPVAYRAVTGSLYGSGPP